MKRVLLMLALAATAAQAQTPDAVLGRIPRGTRVRVELRDQRRVTGWLGGVSSSGITLTPDRDSTAGTDIALADMRRLWERKRAVRPGAIIGAAAGVVAGAFLGLLGNALCTTTTCGSPASDAALGAVLVAPLGAGVGALIGSAIPRWKTTWRSGSTPAGP